MDELLVCMPNEYPPSVIYRKGPGRITAADYDDAITALQEAKTQLEPDGDPCHVCCDSGHQAWECHHNPLMMARLAASRNARFHGSALPWRCFHCDEVFEDQLAAREHFGPTMRSVPVCQKCASCSYPERDPNTL